MTPHPEDLRTPAKHLHEPAEDFPFALLDDPVALAREELEAALRRPVTDAEARALFAWHITRTRADEAAQWNVLERILLWIGGSRPGNYRAAGRGTVRSPETDADRTERRLGLRAAIALAEFVPHGGHRFSTRTLATIFSVSHGEVFRLRQNLREVAARTEAGEAGE